jgi:transcriptional regulator with XRE-family HTH domain
MKDNFIKHHINLGKRIKELRLRQNWSQHELAKRCSVNSAKISKIENAREDLMFSTILEISVALDVPLKELFED